MIGTHVSQLLVSTYVNVESFSEALDEASLYNYDETVLKEEEGEDSMKTPFAVLTGYNGSIKVKVIVPIAISELLSFSKEEVLMKSAKYLANVLTVHDDNNRKLINTTINNEDGGTAHQQPSQFSGMTVVFIGSLPGMSLTVAQAAVKALGEKATPNIVSKATDIVVEGLKGGKKARQARLFGVRVIDHTELMKQIGDQ